MHVAHKNERYLTLSTHIFITHIFKNVILLFF